MFEEWSLNAPTNEATDYPYPPSRQLLACWLVAAWDRIPEALVRKSWEVAGYRPSGELGREASAGTLVHHSAEDLGTMVEKLAGNDGSMAWIHEGNEMEEPFPDEDDNVN